MAICTYDIDAEATGNTQVSMCKKGIVRTIMRRLLRLL